MTAVAVLRRLRTEGPEALLRRAVRRAHQRLDAGALDFGLLPEDVADSATLHLPTPPPLADDRPLQIGWLCTPPVAGSGGHTTMFRMVRALEERGHSCRVLLYDRHGGDLAARAAVVRDAWPWVRADVASATDPHALEGLDVAVATSWETAHVLATRPGAVVHRAYFVQDHEPLFYPRGAEHALAEDSYRFGFTTIALGRMVRRHLEGLGVDAHEVPFGRDTSTYGLLGDAEGPERSGVVFYARAANARRGYRLGLLALRELHRLRPEQEIHVFGTSTGDLGFPATVHGSVPPEQLNRLYNRCAAGLALSFTNISLVAAEMLAAGCTPVVNDSADARADFDTPYAVWARPTPLGLATALARAVDASTPARAAAGAATMRGDSWPETGRQVAGLLERLVRTGDAAGVAVEPAAAVAVPTVPAPDVKDGAPCT